MPILFIRHGESTANSGENDCVDAPLSDKGLVQAQNVKLPFDVKYALVSPLLRARQTFENSVLKDVKMEICHLCRERVFSPRDLLPGEELVIESDEQFWSRVTAFNHKLKELEKEHGSVAVVGHSYFFSAWPQGRGMANC